MSINHKTQTPFRLKTMEDLLREGQNHVNADGVVDIAHLPEPFRSQILPFNDTVNPQPYTGRNFIAELLKVVNGNQRRVKR